MTASDETAARASRPRDGDPDSSRAEPDAATAAVPPSRGLPIISLFFNAVFEKEMRVAGRRPSTYLTRAIYAGLMLALISIFFLGFWQEAHSRGSATEAQQLQKLAPILAVALVWFGFVMLTFIAPATTVPAFLDERRRRTLPALMTTPLSSGQIVAAKLLSQVIQLVILALLSLPVLLAVRVFGGVPAAFLMQAMGIVVSMGLFVAAVALRFSLYRRRADAAIIAAFTVAAAIQSIPLLLVWAFDILTNSRYTWTVAPVTCSPAALMILSVGLLGGFGPTAPAWFWIGGILYNLVWALIFAVSTTISLRRVLRLEGAGIDYLKSKSRRKNKKPTRKQRRAASAQPPAPSTEPDEIASALNAPPPSSADRDSREVADEPVLWRELRQPAFHTRTRLVLYTALIGVLLLFMYGAIGFADEDLHYPIVVIGTLLVLLRAAAGSTASITAERDARTWETLLTTPLSSRAILWGKFAGTLRSQWFVPAVLFAHLLLSVLAGVLRPIVILHVGLIIFSCAAFLSATGVLCGLLIRRSTPAAVLNIALGLSIWLLVPMLGAVTLELFGLHGTWLSDAGFYLVGASNPIYYVVTSVEGAHEGMFSSTTYEAPGNMTVGAFSYTLTIAVSAAVYLLAAMGVLRLAEKLFPAASGRGS